ncbi:MAG: hypothetical protein MUE40_19780 [Anaerolineae bacterium]|nr:hypothetical protein [Anaerolineae bacterium]
MSLKTQQDKEFRGVLWVGRFYRLAGWLGLVATVFFTVWGFISQWQNMTRWSSGTTWDFFSQSLLVAFLFLIMGLALSAVAFGISLGVQVGLNMMKNSQTQVDLLRRMVQQQSETDNVLRHPAEADARLADTPDDLPPAARPDVQPLRHQRR